MAETQGQASTLVDEQITTQPKEEAPVKVKDPRRVAAGKALAARNKAAREAKSQSTSVEAFSPSLNGVMQVAAVVGAGFTLYHGYQVVKPYLEKRNTSESYEIPVQTTFVKPKQPKPATPPPQPLPVKNDTRNTVFANIPSPLIS